jgi:hypothetical protein
MDRFRPEHVGLCHSASQNRHPGLVHNPRAIPCRSRDHGNRSQESILLAKRSLVDKFRVARRVQCHFEGQARLLGHLPAEHR